MNTYTKILENIRTLDFAFQPIVDIQTKEIYAVEALLRNVEKLGYETIHHFFDFIYQHHLLYAVDLVLREKAIKKFTQLENHKSLKLFYNLDNRLLEMKDYASGNTNVILEAHGIEKSTLCFEISERHEVTKGNSQIIHMLENYQREGFDLAIDDFGVGFSGFKLLYEFTPDVIKIDRFFLSDICSDPKKQAIVKNIIQLAKDLGAKVIAEGIEHKSELDTCIDLGCEYVQGYLIQRPSCQISDIKTIYPISA